MVSGAAAQDRMDRTVLAPWLRFLWDSYRNCLELLRNNAQVVFRRWRMFVLDTRLSRCILGRAPIPSYYKKVLPILLEISASYRVSEALRTSTSPPEPNTEAPVSCSCVSDILKERFLSNFLVEISQDFVMLSYLE